jgi:hypothetical protein
MGVKKRVSIMFTYCKLSFLFLGYRDHMIANLDFRVDDFS